MYYSTSLLFWCFLFETPDKKKRCYNIFLLNPALWKGSVQAGGWGALILEEIALPKCSQTVPNLKKKHSIKVVKHKNTHDHRNSPCTIKAEKREKLIKQGKHNSYIINVSYYEVVEVSKHAATWRTTNFSGVFIMNEI